MLQPAVMDLHARHRWQRPSQAQQPIASRYNMPPMKRGSVCEAGCTLSIPVACEPWPGNRNATGVCGAGVGTTAGGAAGRAAEVDTSTATACFLRRSAFMRCRCSLSRLFFRTSERHDIFTYVLIFPLAPINIDQTSAAQLDQATLVPYLL